MRALVSYTLLPFRCFKFLSKGQKGQHSYLSSAPVSCIISNRNCSRTIQSVRQYIDIGKNNKLKKKFENTKISQHTKRSSFKHAKFGKAHAQHPVTSF